MGTHQGGMLMFTPRVQAEQDGPVRVEDLTEVVMSRGRLRQAKQRLVPLEAARHIANANDRPRASHGVSSCGRRLTLRAAHRRFTDPGLLGGVFTLPLALDKTE